MPCRTSVFTATPGRMLKQSAVAHPPLYPMWPNTHVLGYFAFFIQAAKYVYTQVGGVAEKRSLLLQHCGLLRNLVAIILSCACYYEVLAN